MEALRNVTRTFRGETLRIDWFVREDVFDIEYAGETFSRLTPYGFACTLRELGMTDRTITTVRRQLGRQSVTLPAGMVS